MNDKGKYYLKGSSLLYSLTVIILIGGVTSSLVMLSVHDDESTRRWIDRLSISTLSMSGVFAASLDSENQFDGPKDIETLCNGRNHVSSIHSVWGVFDLIDVRASIGEVVHDRRALLGREEANLPVLWITGKSNGLNVCGEARIRGDIWTPSDDIRRGYIEGVSYTGDELVYGSVTRNEPGFPELSSSVIGRCLQLCEGKGVGAEIHQTIEAFEHAPSAVFEASAVVHLAGERNLEGGTYRGVVLRSTDSLYVGKNTTIENCIIQAPSIVFESGFKGSVQAFATDGIHVQRGVEFDFPSAAVLAAHDSSNALINIHESASIDGLILVLANEKSVKPRLKIAPEARVVGRVYVQGGLENRGAIFGNAIVGALTLQTASSSYRGYLLDGKFAASPYAFDTGLGVLKNEQTPLIIKKNVL